MAENCNEVLYRALQIHLDKLPIGYPATDSGIELEILEHLFTPIEAKIALSLTLIKSSISKIQKRLKKQFQEEIVLSDLEKKLDKLFMDGAIMRSGKGVKKQYSNAMLVIGMFEFQVDHLSAEFMEKLHRYLDKGFGEEFFSSSIPQLRTSPHLKAVVPEHIIATYDNMKLFVQNTKQSIQVANCVCKQGSALLGKPCQQTDNYEVCLMFDGESYLDRGQARTITKEECLNILDEAEERGLVLQPGNTYEPFCICLCCHCCCGVLSTANQFVKPAEFFATNYIVELDEAGCIGCGICVKRCQTHAITIEDKKIEDKKAVINFDRCIGCGLCVTKCPKKVLTLRKKEHETVPPKNMVSLYLSILANKVGKKKMMLGMIKMLMGKQL